MQNQYRTCLTKKFMSKPSITLAIKPKSGIQPKSQKILSYHTLCTLQSPITNKTIEDPNIIKSLQPQDVQLNIPRHMNSLKLITIHSRQMRPNIEIKYPCIYATLTLGFQLDIIENKKLIPIFDSMFMGKEKLQELDKNPFFYFSNPLLPNLQFSNTSPSRKCTLPKKFYVLSKEGSLKYSSKCTNQSLPNLIYTSCKIDSFCAHFTKERSRSAIAKYFSDTPDVYLTTFLIS